MNHREIQSAHELAVLESFSRFMEEQGVRMDVLYCPDPPDAIVELNGLRCWVEITDAFQSREWARSITSDSAEDKANHPYEDVAVNEPDRVACEQIMEVVLKKYDKDSMKELLHFNGQGILLVGAYTPLTSLDEIVEKGRDIIMAEIAGRTAIFRAIYLYQDSPSGYLFKQFL